MKTTNNELYFVQVMEPNEIRKHILQTLKEILEAMKRFEKLKYIRHEKTLNINKLRSLLKEANKMFGNLKLKFPQTNLKATVMKEEPKPPKKTANKKRGKSAQEKPNKEPQKEMTELEKLEAQLSAIESKIKTLN